MDLIREGSKRIREGSKRIFIHSHHNSYGDPENEPHVHVVDTEGENSYSLNGGYLLQSYRSINRKTEKWFLEQYYQYRYDWLSKWNSLGSDWIDDLNLDIDSCDILKR